MSPFLCPIRSYFCSPHLSDLCEQTVTTSLITIFVYTIASSMASPTGCPSYNLEWSDYTTFLGYPNNSVSDINQWDSASTYSFWLDGATKTSDWLLQSSTYVAMQGSSSLNLTLDQVEENTQRNFCRTPMITLKDDSQFVSIIFSLVFVIYTSLFIYSAIAMNAI